MWARRHHWEEAVSCAQCCKTREETQKGVSCPTPQVSTQPIYIAREKVFAGTTASLPCRQDNIPFVPVCHSHFARPPRKALPLSGLGRAFLGPR